MTLMQFSGLLVVWLLSTLFIATATWFEFRRVRFNFNVFFSLLFLLTFFFGFPLTSILVFRFDVSVAPPEILLQTLLIAVCFYAVYYVTYKTRLRSASREVAHRPLFTMNRVETHLAWGILMGLALLCVGIFFAHNGFLLFKLNSYSQIFSAEVSGVALKRFFYFFIPAMLVVYFLRQDYKAWIFFLVSTVAFGLLTYAIVGGTRANIIIAFAIFLFIGIILGWISLWMLAAAGVLGIVGMFWLALKRYGMNVSGDEAFYTFLYLTRDTFSPWENLALLLQNYDKIDFQGLAPMIRDFYIRDNMVCIDTSPCAKILFRSDKHPARVFRPADDRPFTHAEFDFQSRGWAGPYESYIRAEVVDAEGRRAWTNPIFLHD